MMDDSIPNSGFVDQSYFWILYIKTGIGAVPIPLLNKVFVENKKIIFQVSFEELYIRPMAFTCLELIPRFE